jgi:hypothetical protein
MLSVILSSEEEMIKKRAPEVVMSVIAGILILSYGIIFLAGIFVGLPPGDETLNELRVTLGEEGFRMFLIRNAIAGIAAGSAVLLVSRMLDRKPEESRRWGIMILVLTSMSMVGMGFLNLGMVPGVVLGIIAGIIAIKKGRKLPMLEVPKQKIQPEATAPITEPKELRTSMIYRCSICDVNFGSDKELTAHVLKFHTK